MKSRKRKRHLFFAVTLVFQMYTSTPSVSASSLPGPSLETQETLDRCRKFFELYKSEKGRFPKTQSEVKGFQTKVPKRDCWLQKELCQSAMSYIDGWKGPLKFEFKGKKFRIIASHGFYLTEKSTARDKENLIWDNDGVVPVDPEPSRDYCDHCSGMNKPRDEDQQKH
jgi:hypothetical protein